MEEVFRWCDHGTDSSIGVHLALSVSLWLFSVYPSQKRRNHHESFRHDIHFEFPDQQSDCRKLSWFRLSILLLYLWGCHKPVPIFVEYILTSNKAVLYVQKSFLVSVRTVHSLSWEYIYCRTSRLSSFQLSFAALYEVWHHLAAEKQNHHTMRQFHSSLPRRIRTSWAIGGHKSS